MYLAKEREERGRREEGNIFEYPERDEKESMFCMYRGNDLAFCGSFACMSEEQISIRGQEGRCQDGDGWMWISIMWSFTL